MACLRHHAARIARAALVTCAALGAVAPAHAAEKAIWGPATTLPDGSSAFTLYRSLGVDTLQLGLHWADVAPTRPARATDPSDPAYRWPPALDGAAAQAARYRIRLALLVTTTPPWANGGRSPIWTPSDPRDYADFLRAAARRYPTVRRWMIWGEPNRADRFQPNSPSSAAGPRAYARLLDAAYGALRRASRGNRVIGAMTWTSGTVRPRAFLRRMRLPDGRPPRLDWFGHNPFPARFPDISEPPIPGGYRDISDSDTFLREIRQVYKRRVPLWMSEFTIQSDRGSATFATYVSRAEQARYVTAAYRIADDLGDDARGLGWFSLVDEPEAPGSARWGLLASDLRRKPAYWAMVRAPSVGGRPAVRTARRARRGTLAGRGIRVRVRPRRSGTVAVELRQGRTVLARRRMRATSGRWRTLRLRARVRPGRYAVHVRAPRGATVRRTLRVR